VDNTIPAPNTVAGIKH